MRSAGSEFQILHIHWSQHVTNAEISARTGLPPVIDLIRRRRLSVFDHIARLTQGTPIHNALHCQVGLASGRSLGRDWRRRPGRPRARWTDQLRNDTGSVPADLWRQTGHPTGSWWSDATARAGYPMTTMTTTSYNNVAAAWQNARLPKTVLRGSAWHWIVCQNLR